MDYVNTHTAEEIAKIIKPQFKENDLDTITTIVKRYKDQDTWKDNLIFEKDSFDLLQDILDLSLIHIFLMFTKYTMRSPSDFSFSMSPFSFHPILWPMPVQRK